VEAVSGASLQGVLLSDARDTGPLETCEQRHRVEKGMVEAHFMAVHRRES
jgi:hypothetical protein